MKSKFANKFFKDHPTATCLAFSYNPKNKPKFDDFVITNSSNMNRAAVKEITAQFFTHHLCELNFGFEPLQNDFRDNEIDVPVTEAGVYFIFP